VCTLAQDNTANKCNIVLQFSSVLFLFKVNYDIKNHRYDLRILLFTQNIMFVNTYSHIQWKLLNGITLGQTESNNIDWMITITNEIYLLICCKWDPEFEMWSHFTVALSLSSLCISLISLSLPLSLSLPPSPLFPTQNHHHSNLVGVSVGGCRTPTKLGRFSINFKIFSKSR